MEEQMRRKEDERRIGEGEKSIVERKSGERKRGIKKIKKGENLPPLNVLQGNHFFTVYIL